MTLELQNNFNTCSFDLKRKKNYFFDPKEKNSFIFGPAVQKSTKNIAHLVPILVSFSLLIKGIFLILFLFFS